MFDLRQDCRNRMVVAAHRGASGGNIPCNTIAAYETALRQGADMIEIDVTRSLDGELFVFHPGMEPAHLGSDRLITAMTREEVKKLRFLNQDRTPTQFPVNTLDEVLERFRGRCYINVDKFWSYPCEIAERIRAYGMQDQVLVKTKPDEAIFREVERVARDLPYMIIARDSEDLSEHLIGRRMRYMGVEALFREESAEICSKEYLDRMHRLGLIVWANAIVYDTREQLAAGHNDDISAPGDPDRGWGWIAGRGFDVIQTDWTAQCVRYLESIGKH